MAVLCVLPARLASQRIPRKPLQIIAGRPLVEWSWRAACAVPGVDRVVIAADSEEIVEAARGFGATALLTSPAHPSGTDRVAEVAEADGADVIVNFQADEPFLSPESVATAVEAVTTGRRDIATLATPVSGEEEWRASSVVKVVRASDGRALYFSRAPVPYPRDGASPDTGGERLRHVGLYVYTADALRRWVALPPSPLEEIERLEQLRALEAGMEIGVCVVPADPHGVDTPDDIARADRLLRATDNAQEKRESHV